MRVPTPPNETQYIVDSMGHEKFVASQLSTSSEKFEDSLCTQLVMTFAASY